MDKKPKILFIYSLVFIIVLFFTAGLINLILPSSKTPPTLGDVSVKLEYFADHKDDYDVIFLGPSTTYLQVIPKVFDESLSANGNSLKSFNLGILSANVAEMDFYLQKILALKPAKLKWIFLDCLVNSFVEEEPTLSRNVYWHTPTKTLENFQLIAESTLPWKIKISAFYANSISFLHRWLGIGYFSNFWHQSSEALPAGISSDKLLQEAGYYANDWMKNSEAEKKVFYSKLESYQQKLTQAKLGIIDPENTYPEKSYATKIIKRLVSRIDDLEKSSNIQVEPIFLIPPALDSVIEHSPILEAVDLGYISTLFAFNNPNSFASLYEVSRRSDERHLNYQGSQEFSRTLAEKFSQHLKLASKETYNQPFISQSQN
ncbi:hypothetical protein H6G94_26630 [Nostoc punctiforme FACHB-252]|uniref:SGNH/GDSL hydrolase family protein n=1 Tax=Nostoc punctiforme FACHB-252 TaxID=1357509 RepID=A0ABR8HHQ7_NOSPU|nr:hypothetical protein [Nostoc punctiforme]MBD2614811.1 hypothetical protein [Nostoc punctiforme FACHB-252]